MDRAGWLDDGVLTVARFRERALLGLTLMIVSRNLNGLLGNCFHVCG